MKRKERAFKVAGPNWIGERSFGWLGRQRRLPKGYECRAQTSEALIAISSRARTLRRLAPK